MLLLLLSGILQAQVSNKDPRDNGIYFSDKDHLSGKLSYGFNKEKGVKFKDIKKLSISIKETDTTFKFYFDEICGYRKDGIDWRVFNEEFYKVDYMERFAYILSLAVYLAQYHQPFISAAI